MLNFIIDTNSLISALVKDSATRKILFHPEFAFHAPVHLCDEITSHFGEMAKKSGFSEDETKLLFNFLTSYIKFHSTEEFKDKLNEAALLISHLNDLEFVALALAIPNDGIWTADKHFENQNKIKIWKTQELLKFI
jgi:predicted nucleic acid-binding protein